MQPEERRVYAGAVVHDIFQLATLIQGLDMDVRVANACEAMKKLNISPQRVKPVLKQLLKLYQGNWDFIEAENYRTLADTIFEVPMTRDRVAKSEPVTKRLRSGSTHSHSAKGEPSEIVLANGQVDYVDHDGMKMLSSKELLSCESTSDKLLINKKSAQTQTSKDMMTRVTTTKSQKQQPVCLIDDITRGKEKVKISLVEDGVDKREDPPKFFYIPHSIVYNSAHVSMSVSRISEEDCCGTCSGNCLSSQVPCACARETGGEFAYEPNGLLKETFLNANIELKRKPQDHHYVFCSDCPLERVKNESKPHSCEGHLVRRFIKECWSLCGCDIQCGNRIVQRGITRNFQVFWTPEGKGWGIRSTENIPKGAFVFEFAGEILTNQELFERNLQKKKNERHTYPVCLDADWGSESILQDEEALCLDATFIGNVARFVNHRCGDANLLDIPVQVETMDRHYYHLAFFTAREVKAYEELTWDYGIDFNDRTHPIEAFKCRCGSSSCEDTTRGGKGRKKPSK